MEELKEALKAKVITEKELEIISKNIHLVPEKDLKRLGLIESKAEEVKSKKK